MYQMSRMQARVPKTFSRHFVLLVVYVSILVCLSLSI